MANQDESRGASEQLRRPVHRIVAEHKLLSLCEELQQLRQSQNDSDKELRQLRATQRQSEQELQQLRQSQDGSGRELLQLRASQQQSDQELMQLREAQRQANQELRQLRESRCQSEQELRQLRKAQRQSDQELRQLREAQRQSDQAAIDLGYELRQWRGEPDRLRGMTPAELEGVVHAVEGSLSRVLAAHSQALAAELSSSLQRSEEELLCPVCLDACKDMVFQCGHQTCAACSLLVQDCPICRVRIAQRIKVF